MCIKLFIGATHSKARDSFILIYLITRQECSRDVYYRYQKKNTLETDSFRYYIRSKHITGHLRESVNNSTGSGEMPGSTLYDYLTAARDLEGNCIRTLHHTRF